MLAVEHATTCFISAEPNVRSLRSQEGAQDFSLLLFFFQAAAPVIEMGVFIADQKGAGKDLRLSRLQLQIKPHLLLEKQTERHIQLE